MEMVHPTKFVEAVIEMDKDVDTYFIEEMVVSRISPANFNDIINELVDHVSSNETNGARYAIETIMKYNWKKVVY